MYLQNTSKYCPSQTHKLAKMQSLVLGSTPLRTQSRRRLFATPLQQTPQHQVQMPSSSPAASSGAVTLETSVGTLVDHVVLEGNTRSGQLGVVLGKTVTDTTKLDILWTTDGVQSSTDPQHLTLHTMQTPSTSPTPSTSQSAPSSIPAVLKPELQRQYMRTFKSLLPSKFPKELICPLDSVDEEQIQRYQMQMDNFVCSAHPRIRQLITGDLEPPLLSFKPYLDHMQALAGGGDYVFNHATADEDIKRMRDAGKHDLADACDVLLDNPPAFDGFRPCNSALFHAFVKSIKPDDLYILQKVQYGDGIGIRNLVWDAMTGDACKSKMLLAMTHSTKINDVKYRFERHGVAKYFAKIHAAISKLAMLGVKKPDWEIFSIICDHMSTQCMEFRQAVSDIRDQIGKDQASVTLKYMEKVFKRKESVFKIGTSTKGTPVGTPTSMNPPPKDIPNIHAAKATPKTEEDAKPIIDERSKFWPEKTARKNYGAKGSHKPGSCKYGYHKNETDHCWEGCSKCGGCYIMHKRRRMINEGRRLCTQHKYATHLQSECKGPHRRSPYKKRGRGNQEGGRDQRRSPSESSDKRNNRSGDRDRRPHNARSADFRDGSRSRSRSRSPPRRRARREPRSRSPSPSSIPAHYIKPRYLHELQQFARHGRSPRPDHGHRASSARYDDLASRVYSSRAGQSTGYKQYPSPSAMQAQHPPRRDMGHVPRNDDGIPTLYDLIEGRNNKRYRLRTRANVARRRVVASATEKTCSRNVKPQTYMDSGAGTTICDDDELYIPGTVEDCPGEVVWGDGSTRKIKYTGRASGIGRMVSTGGAASTHLVSVGSTLDELRRTTRNDFVMGFDNDASYLIRGARFEKGSDGEYRLHQYDADAPVLQTRGDGPAGVYEVPLYDVRASDEADACALAASFNKMRACKAHLFSYPSEPQWQDLIYNDVVYDARVASTSTNAYALTKAIMRKHRQWGHPGREVLRQMLLAKGTTRSKRMARRVHDLSEPCNACLSGSSTKQPHTRDDDQPSTRATRPMQHMASDCAGEQNIVSMGTPTLSGATIIFIIICTYSRYLWLWLLKSVSEVTSITTEWLHTTARQRKRIAANNDTEILTWRTDNGPDFPRAFTDLLANHGIYHQRTGARASQQNPHAESALNPLQKRVRTHLAWSCAPRRWWGEASLYTAVTTNHVTSLSNPGKAAPITVMYGRKPDFAKMHPFGCLAFIHITKKARNGALNKATHYGVLLGYATGSDGRIVSYRVYNYDTNRFVYPADVTFNPDCPAIPYIASIRMLAPKMRLRERRVCKLFNEVPYYGKIVDVRKDTDGEILYGVAYSDNDYEEYTFREIMEILQPYDPAEDKDDVLEITPFFGSSKSLQRATDTTPTAAQQVTETKPSSNGTSVTDSQSASPPIAHKQSPANLGSTSNDSPAPRRSTRVRVVRRPYNAGAQDISSIPSSQNKRRLRSAMGARTKMFESVLALSSRSKGVKVTRTKPVEPIVIPPGTFVDQLPIPKNYDDAVLGPYRNYWIPAIAEELQSLKNYKVWKKQKLPEGIIPVRGRFVFKWKPDSQNHLERAKARFSMQGCTQIKGVHFKKTYAPVAFAESFRLIIKIGVDLDYEIDVTDLKVAYLTCYLEPNVTLFMEPPPGVEVEPGYGLRVIRALYGSMQGAQRLDVMKHTSLTKIGYKRMAAESSIYFTLPPSPLGLSIICTVSDDFAIVSATKEISQEIKRRLSTIWTITDKGPIKWMLNLRIRRDRPAGILKLEQSAYVERKLREFGIEHLPAKKLPMDPRKVLSASQCPTTDEEKREAQKLPYRARTGGLNYLRLTRPDMCCTNSILGQRNAKWGVPHFEATTHAWQYAGGTKHWGLLMRKSGWKFGQKLRSTVYVDAGHGSCPDTRRSRDGFFVFLNGDPVYYGCKLQPGVPAQSTSGAEYRAITAACNALIWMRSCLNELGMELEEPVLFREDNQAAISMATNYMTSKRTKHIDIKHHVIRYWCKEDVMDFTYISTDDQLADIMTKVLTGPLFSRHRAHCMSDMHVEDKPGRFSPDA